jgi:hypothetical protein
VPFKKQGWIHAIEPVLKQWMTAQQQWPVRLDELGRDCIFTVTGKERDKTISAFQFVAGATHAIYSTVPDEQKKWLEYLYGTFYMPLEKSHKTLTDEELDAYIAYYEPIAEAFHSNGEIAKYFNTCAGQKSQGALDPRCRPYCLNYLKTSKTSQPSQMQMPTQLPTAQAQQHPIPQMLMPSPSMTGHQPPFTGTMPQPPMANSPQMPPAPPMAQMGLPGMQPQMPPMSMPQPPSMNPQVGLPNIPNVPNPAMQAMPQAPQLGWMPPPPPKK